MSRRPRVYFIEAAGLIKIGVSTNVTTRVGAIRASCPVPVKLLGSFYGDYGDERSLHMRYEEHRSHGEWFRDCRQIRAMIQARCKDGPGEPVEPAQRRYFNRSNAA